jgi:ribosomal protein L7/L12
MTNVELPPEAIAAIGRGRMMDAIKLIRERNGCGLKEAKDAVAAHLDRSPALKSRLAKEGNEALRRGLIRLLVIAALVVAAYQWLIAR